MRVVMLLTCVFSFAAQGQWTKVPSMIGSRFHHGAATGPDGYVYVIGGVQNGQCTNAVERLDPRNTQTGWQEVPDFANVLTARCDLAVVTGADGYLYAIGGTKGGESTGDVQRYNTAKKQWEPVDSLEVARTHPAAAVGPDLRLYVLGGYDAASKAEIDSVEVLDNGVWQVLPDVTAKGTRIGMTGFDGNVYTYGIGGGAKVAQFDGVTFQEQGGIQPATHPESDYTGTAGPDGLMYLLGVGGTGKVYGSSVVATYAPFGYVGTTSPMSGRVFAGAATAAEGRVFMTGGYVGGIAHELHDVEAYGDLYAPLASDDATAWFGFDEPTGSPIIDQWGGNNGTAIGPLKHTTSGKVSDAASFTGSQYVKVDGGSVDFGAGDMTIEGWINWTRVGSERSVTTLLDKRTYKGGYAGYSVFLYNRALGVQLANGTNYVNYGGVRKIADQGKEWTHIAVTLNRATNELRLYVNGALDKTFTPLAGSISSTAPLYIGRHSFYGSYYRGGLDELTFYRRALSWVEIRTIFLAGRNGKIPL